MPRDRNMDELYRRYGSSVLRRARSVLGNEADAQDVLQHVFCALAENPEQFRGQSSMLTWLYSATNHQCLNRLRDSRRRSALLRERGLPASEIARTLDPEAHAQLRELLAGMPDELAQVAIYYYCDELSQAEIAELLGCSRRHVGNLLERARALYTPEPA
jgi:RNA polymerase sigma-70 factor (ECF subfamily)